MKHSAKRYASHIHPLLKMDPPAGMWGAAAPTASYFCPTHMRFKHTCVCRYTDHNMKHSAKRYASHIHPLLHADRPLWLARGRRRHQRRQPRHLPRLRLAHGGPAHHAAGEAYQHCSVHDPTVTVPTSAWQHALLPALPAVFPEDTRASSPLNMQQQIPDLAPHGHVGCIVWQRCPESRCEASILSNRSILINHSNPKP